MASSLAADPFAWAFIAALFSGIAAGQCLRAFAAAGRGRGDALRLRSRRIARAIAYLSLAILAAAALFVLADKGALASAWASPAILLGWAALVLAFGLCAGTRPLLLGLPLAVIAGAALVLVRLSLEGWLPLRSAAAPKVEIARLLPYEVGASSFRGQLELPERDSVPVAQEVGFAASSAALRVEGIELKEPLRLAACIVLPGARGAAAAYTTTLSLYRVVGLAAPGVTGNAFATPRWVGLLDAALPLRAGEGLESGLPPARARALFGLAERTRRTSAAAPLVALDALVFDLDAKDFSITSSPGH